MTRRFDIGPVVLALGAIGLLVALFLTWVDSDLIQLNAWQAFEVVDAMLAALAIAALVAAVGFLTPAVDVIDRRVLPWLVGAAFVLVVNQLVSPGIIGDASQLGTGAWVAFGSTIVMAIGTLLSLGRVSFAVAVEGRDRVQRVAAVDHRPPPTETGAPVARSSSSLLHPRGDEPEAGETT